jgi:putative GTP pyrophosphokinase
VKNSELDRVGDRLRAEVTAADLTALDGYRRGFRLSYDEVVDRIRSEYRLEVSGRPAKSTTAIVDKLLRSSMRLTQMQDIAGCRVVVPDVTSQSRLVAGLGELFEATVIDRRGKPSHGYRAIHVVVRCKDLPVEVQVRTDLQHGWAELSEKLADTFGTAVKYGGGPASIRKTLDSLSTLIAQFEQHFDLGDASNERMAELKQEFRHAMIDIATALKAQS